MTVAKAKIIEIGTIFLTTVQNDSIFCGGSNKQNHEEATYRDEETPKQWSIVTNRGKRKFMAWRTNLLYKTSVVEQEVHPRIARKAADARKCGTGRWRRAKGVGGDAPATAAVGCRVRSDPDDLISVYLTVATNADLGVCQIVRQANDEVSTCSRFLRSLLSS